MSEILDTYLDCLQRLIKQLDEKYIRQADTLLQQLRENIDETKSFDDTRELKHERSKIISKLNILTRKTLGMSFYDYCGLSTIPPGEVEQQELPENSLPFAHNYITSACNYVSTMYEASQNASQLFLSDDDIWPAQCQDAISIFQRLQQPLLPDNLPYSSLEVTLSSINEQVHELIGLIDSFSPFGRDKSVKARNLRYTIRQKLNDFPHYLTPAIDLIDMLGKSIGKLHICTLPFRNDDEVL